MTGVRRQLLAGAPRPRCALCKRPVEQATQCYDEANRQTCFWFRCHGEVERVALFDEEVLWAESILIRDCFVTRRLPEG